ncbi:MAG: hypothetical protein RL757_3259 [Bacteroidota bacterium]|jgi:hypothetical protein
MDTIKIKNVFKKIAPPQYKIAFCAVFTMKSDIFISIDAIFNSIGA